MSRTIKFQFLFGPSINEPYFVENGKRHLLKTTLTIEQLMNGEYESSIPHMCHLVAKRQFAGLADTNDIEVYEGDMLKDAQNGFIWEVAFDERGCFVARDPSDHCGFVFFDDYDFEVIGNIYENPELVD